MMPPNPDRRGDIARSRRVQWGAITTVLVAAPVIGKMAKTGLERSLGTFIGACVALQSARCGSLAMPSPTFFGVAPDAWAACCCSSRSTMLTL